MDWIKEFGDRLRATGKEEEESNKTSAIKYQISDIRYHGLLSLLVDYKGDGGPSPASVTLQRDQDDRCKSITYCPFLMII